MKLKTEQFQKALKTTRSAVAHTELIDQATSFIFKDGFVIGYNDEICISVPVDGLDAEGAVKADALYNYISKLKKPEMELKTTPKEMQIKSGRSRAGLPLNTEVVVPLDQITPPGKWKPLPPDFMDYARMAAGATATDHTMPKLTCVDVRKEGIITGSDNFRILQCTLEAFEFDGFLIPSSSVKIAASLQPTKISVTKEWVHLENDDAVQISCRTYPEQYDDVTDFMGVEGPQFTFPRTFNEVMDRTRVFAQMDVTQDEEVKVTVGNNRIKITAKNESGWASEEINHSTDDEPFSFTIIPYLLKDILTRTDTCTVSETALLFQGEGWKYVSALIDME